MKIDLSHLIKLGLKTTLLYGVYILFLFSVPIYNSAAELIEKIGQTGLQQAVIGEHDFRVEVVDSREDKRQGLSGRESLDKNVGMLFIFDPPQVQSFWMKDMNFPIDIIWINEFSEIMKIDHNVSPDGYPEERFVTLIPVKYVIEVNAGFAKKNDLKIGDVFTLF